MQILSKKRGKGFFSKLRKFKSKGIALSFEVIMFLGFLSLIVGIFYSIYRNYQKQRDILEVKKEVEVIFDFLRNLYTSNLKAILDGCSGFRSCPYTLTPEPVDENTFRVHLFDIALLNKIRGYCKIEESGRNSYDISCYSAYAGRPFRVTILNYQQYQKPYYAPYRGNYFTIELQEPALGTRFALRLDTEINKSLLDTANKLETLKQAIQSWTKLRYDLALANECGEDDNPPTDPVGGLGSWDDELVAWIWQLFGTAPYQNTDRGEMPILCRGIDTGCDCGENCGCPNFVNNPNVWRNDDSFCVIDSSDEWDLFLQNLEIDPKYMLDGFGNLLTFVPLSDANGNPLNCPPPPPRCCYPYDIPKKGSLGIYDTDRGEWVYRIEIVYPY
jgi:hypothetical protein